MCQWFRIGFFLLPILSIVSSQLLAASGIFLPYVNAQGEGAQQEISEEDLEYLRDRSNYFYGGREIISRKAFIETVSSSMKLLFITGNQRLSPDSYDKVVAVLKARLNTLPAGSSVVILNTELVDSFADKNKDIDVHTIERALQDAMMELYSKETQGDSNNSWMKDEAFVKRHWRGGAPKFFSFSDKNVADQLLAKKSEDGQGPKATVPFIQTVLFDGEVKDREINISALVSSLINKVLARQTDLVLFEGDRYELELATRIIASLWHGRGELNSEFEVESYVGVDASYFDRGSPWMRAATALFDQQWIVSGLLSHVPRSRFHFYDIDDPGLKLDLTNPDQMVRVYHLRNDKGDLTFRYEDSQNGFGLEGRVIRDPRREAKELELIFTNQRDRAVAGAGKNQTIFPDVLGFKLNGRHIPWQVLESTVDKDGFNVVRYKMRTVITRGPILDIFPVTGETRHYKSIVYDIERYSGSALREAERVIANAAREGIIQTLLDAQLISEHAIGNMGNPIRSDEIAHPHPDFIDGSRVFATLESRRETANIALDPVQSVDFSRHAGCGSVFE